MGHLKYNYRFSLKPNGRVIVRVRWDSAKKEVSFCIDAFAEKSKWNAETQRAIKNTSHNIKGVVYLARDINKEIERASDFIDDFFARQENLNVMPTCEQLKVEVEEQLVKPVVRQEESTDNNTLMEETLSMDELLEEFLVGYKKESNWGPSTHFKYKQIWNLLLAFDKTVTLTKMTKSFLNDFKCWMIENNYKNSSITKHFRNIRCMLRWLKDQGHPVAEDIFSYKANLAVPMKAVIYLKYDEILQFENFKFPESKKYLSRARDYFCFMCYTSLRYSDLAGLKKAAISDGYIDMYAQKTRGRLKIPVLSHAQRILDRYNDTPGEKAFAVPSNQKMNDYLKEAAELAGLNREVITTTFCGAKRVEQVHKLHEIISNHCARRTFVCISLSLGIPQTVVMKCTGHSDYAAMKPYICISDETSRREIAKWEIGSVRNQLNKVLDSMNIKQLNQMLAIANTIS